jgi:septum formation protein
VRKIILASSSPRRAELLQQIGLPFDICVCPVDEFCLPGLAPHVLVEVLATRKAAAVAKTAWEGLVIGADTVVVWQEQVLGKPGDENEAMQMLQKLSGDTHAVYTGVALLDPASGRSLVRHEKTRVHFKRLEEDEIRRYVATGEPLDKSGGYAPTMYRLNESSKSLRGSLKEENSLPKGTGKAGAYAIQGIGALFVERIEGDYTNVVGLPLCLLGKMLKEFGLNIP